MKKIVILIPFLAALWFSACETAPQKAPDTGKRPAQSFLSAVKVHTQPSGGTITIEETGDVYKDGDVFQLPAGRYTFTAKKEGFSGGSVTVAVDGKMPKKVIVALGQAAAAVSPKDRSRQSGKDQERKTTSRYSSVSVVTEPAGATIRVEETGKIYQDGETFQLPAGRYTLTTQKEGYPSRSTIVAVDGKTPKKVMIALIKSEPEGPVEKEPKKPDEKAVIKTESQGIISVSTKPDGATIYLDDKKIGVGGVEIGPLDFGTYTLRGEKQLSRTVRVKGTQTFVLQKPKPMPVVLLLETRERQYQGQWMDAARALALEEDRYQNHRVKNPFRIKIVLDSKGFTRLARDDNLHHRLQNLLRVGDSVVFVHQLEKWTIWKRHRHLTADFEGEVLAFREQRPLDDSWKDGENIKTIALTRPAEPLAEMAFSLSRSKTEHPLIDLAAGQLGAKGETVYRSRNDGVLTILSLGGEQVAVAGAKEKVFGRFRMDTVAAADKTVTINWASPPDRLLVVSGRAFKMVSPPRGSHLLIKEKKIVTLCENAPVGGFIRLSKGPDYQGWQRQVFKADGPLASQMDLSRDEIGPNSNPGDYRRIWVLQIKDGNTYTQRQIETGYRVAGGVKNFEGDQFIRRKGSGKKRQ
jgi:hypothetical protein